MKEKIFDTIIIGAGIAGLTAGIYAARNKMNFLVIGEEFGGQMNLSGEVLNYPGIVETTGVDFRSTIKKQMEFNNFKINENETVEKVKKENGIFEITSNKNKYQSKTVIIATGSKPRKLNVPGEEEFAKKGVHYCAICDGPLYDNKDVAIIGGGNSALEAADFMKNIARKIYIINIEKSFTGFQYLIDLVKSFKNIEIINDADTKEIIGDTFVKELKYHQNGDAKKISVNGVFIEIGRIPNQDFIKDLVEIDEHNHVVIDCQTQTSVPGIFAAGDITNVHEYQYVISAGHGCTALIKAAKYLSSREE